MGVLPAKAKSAAASLFGVGEGGLELLECVVVVLLHGVFRLLVLGRVHGVCVCYGSAEALRTSDGACVAVGMFPLLG